MLNKFSSFFPHMEVCSPPLSRLSIDVSLAICLLYQKACSSTTLFCRLFARYAMTDLPKSQVRHVRLKAVHLPFSGSISRASRLDPVVMYMDQSAESLCRCGDIKDPAAKSCRKKASALTRINGCPVFISPSLCRCTTDRRRDSKSHHIFDPLYATSVYGMQSKVCIILVDSLLIVSAAIISVI